MSENVEKEIADAMKNTDKLTCTWHLGKKDQCFKRRAKYSQFCKEHGEEFRRGIK